MVEENPKAAPWHTVNAPIGFCQIMTIFFLMSDQYFRMVGDEEEEEN
ncbi:MAG: hypothetical protein K9K88_07620 [Desulfobacterales bacterium]|nr:hypothetical protein [Desulfobacterales bacterium]